MTDPRTIGAFDASLPAPELRIAWDLGSERGADLPSAYFDEVIVSMSADTPPITAVAHTAERELTVTFADLGDHLATHDTIDFTLEFPDREFFIDCNHQGMPDRYLLTVSLVVDGGGALLESTFEQTTLFGPI